MKKTIICSLMSLAASANTYSDVIFSEDFETTPLSADWITVDGTFIQTISGGSLALRSDSGATYGTIYSTEVDTSDYTVSARVKQWNQNSHGGIVFRYDELDGTFYKLSTDHGGSSNSNFLRLEYFDGANYILLAEQESSANMVQFRDLKVVAFQNTFDCFLDGTLIFSHTEDDPALINSEGLIGFDGGGTSAIDDIIVDDDISESSILLVQDDFQDGSDTDGSPHTWTVESGERIIAPTALGLSVKGTSSPTPFISTTGEETWGNYRIGANLLGTLGLSKPGVIGRYRSDGTYYKTHIERNTNDIVLSYFDGVSFFELSRLDVKDDLFKDDVSDYWHYVEMEMQNESILIYYDGTLAATVVDVNSATGKPGISGFTNSFFDNVLVTSSGSSFAPPSQSSCSGASQSITQPYWTDQNLNVDMRMDVHYPEQGENCPTIIYLRGGGWSSPNYELGGADFVARQLDRGYAVIAVEYRTSDEAIFPAQIHDVKNAIRYIRANASTLTPNGLDASKIVAFGPSAGGHLALLAGLTDGISELEDLTQGNATQSSSIQGVVSCYAPTDLNRMDEQFLSPEIDMPGAARHNDATSPESRLVGCDGLNGNPDGLDNPNCASDFADPITYVTSDDAPVLMSHGDSDATVPYLQSEELFAALNTAGVTVTYELIPGEGHKLSSCPDDNLIDAFVDSIYFPEQ